MRRNDGKETWHRLLEWDKGQAPAERLAATILINEGFRGIDPIHPLGGRDGLKDMVISHGGKKWIGAVFFPRGKQKYKEIKKKFIHDLNGVESNGADGIVFITNQELRSFERKDITEINENIDVQIYHLERISSLLNTPKYYGVRMEFLEIEMNKEEQVSFFASQNDKMSNIEIMLGKLVSSMNTNNNGNQMIKEKSLAIFMPHEENNGCLRELRSIAEIKEMIEEFVDKIWYDRHLSLKYHVDNGLETIPIEIWNMALDAEQQVINKYGDENLGPYSDFEWGMLNGKLSALRWVMGDEWDILDT